MWAMWMCVAHAIHSYNGSCVLAHIYDSRTTHDGTLAPAEHTHWITGSCFWARARHIGNHQSDFVFFLFFSFISFHCLFVKSSSNSIEQCCLLAYHSWSATHAGFSIWIWFDCILNLLADGVTRHPRMLIANTTQFSFLLQFEGECRRKQAATEQRRHTLMPKFAMNNRNNCSTSISIGACWMSPKELHGQRTSTMTPIGVEFGDIILMIVLIRLCISDATIGFAKQEWIIDWLIEAWGHSMGFHFYEWNSMLALSTTPAKMTHADNYCTTHSEINCFMQEAKWILAAGFFFLL